MHFIVLNSNDGVWNFTDDARGLLREPLVAGIPAIVDKHIARLHLNYTQSRKGLYVVFSDAQFPTATLSLTKVRDEFGGATYRADNDGDEGWLCPALLKFFDTAPDRIWISMDCMPVRL
jgi:hypothetical protein